MPQVTNAFPDRPVKHDWTWVYSSTSLAGNSQMMPEYQVFDCLWNFAYLLNSLGLFIFVLSLISCRWLGLKHIWGCCRKEHSEKYWSNWKSVCTGLWRSINIVNLAVTSVGSCFSDIEELTLIKIRVSRHDWQYLNVYDYARVTNSKPDMTMQFP